MCVLCPPEMIEMLDFIDKPDRPTTTFTLNGWGFVRWNYKTITDVYQPRQSIDSVNE